MVTLAASMGSIYTEGWQLVLAPLPLLVIAAGVLTGLIIGSLPGLTANMGVAVLLPLTFTMDPVSGIAALAGIWFGALYGGTIPAVLLNMPGTPGDIMTTLDGFPMSQRGDGGRAIGIGIFSSFLGGLGSVIVLAAASPYVAQIARNFGSKEFFAITLLGISIIAYVSDDSIFKGIISALIGIAVATVGLDTLTGQARFTFGQPRLMSGISFVAVIVGLFGLAEVLEQLYRREHKMELRLPKVYGILASVKDILPVKWVIARSSVVGVTVGAIPGAGATIASVLAYGLQKRISKPSDGMGKGAPMGVAASDSANNAATGGAMITMLSLGIPGDAITAVLLGGLLIHGIRPGPLLFQGDISFISALFVSFVVANVFLLLFGLLLARHIPKILAVPRGYLLPTILVLCFTGVYALSRNIFDVYVMFAMGLLGFLFSRAGIPKSPMILAIVLAPILEQNLRRAIILSNNDVGATFVAILRNPISGIIFIIACLMLVMPVIQWVLGRLRGNRPPVEESSHV